MLQSSARRVDEGIVPWLRVASLVAVAAASASPVSAIDWKGRFWLGARVADYLPADEQGGGFRFNAQAFGNRTENEVKPGEKPLLSVAFGYGLKQWEVGKSGRPLQLSIEIEASRFETGFGDETGFIDENASSRIVLPGRTTSDPDGDETFETFPLGDLTVTPILVNALFHWGSARADFYVGGGGGVVLAEITEDKRYASFVGDIDGEQDVNVDDGFAVCLKTGSNVRLTKGGRMYLYFEAEFFTTNLLGGGPKVAWPGVDGFFGTRDYDSDGDGTVDTFGIPANLHVVDPGKVRLDGVFAGIGLRYRFGGGKATKESAPASPAASGS
jgi:hypothetical protein